MIAGASTADRAGTPAGTGGRRRRSLALGLASAALSLGLGAGTVLPAAAEPPVTVEDAKAQIEQLQVEANAVDQQYAGVQDQLAKDRTRLKQKRADVKTQTNRVEDLKQQVGRAALAQFQNRDLDTAARLVVTSDAEGFLSQISTVQKVTEQQNTVLQDFHEQQATLTGLERSTAIDLAALEEQERDLQTLRDASKKKIDQSEAVLAKLTKEQRRALEAERKRQAAEAKADAERAQSADAPSGSATRKNPSNRSPNSSSKASSPDNRAPAGSSSSSKGAAALAWAKTQLGKPYRFGATGPEAYDCSGLTGKAWKAAGVSLPRTSRQQFTAGRPVAKSDLQPGDLVFFYSDISHNGLYAGNGTILHSPRTGKTVEYTKMSYMPFAGARRPG